MTMRISFSILIVSCALFVSTIPMRAHHAFGAEFDPDAPIRLKGKVVKLEWVNPHAWIHIEVTKPDGTKSWRRRAGSNHSSNVVTDPS